VFLCRLHIGIIKVSGEPGTIDFALTHLTVSIR
jgi:hypothetical protein